MPRYFFLGIAAICLTACASYSQSFSTIEQSLYRNKPQQALELLEKQSHSERDMFLYHANKAILLRITGKYADSNMEIEKAKKIIDDFTATSISEESAAFIINDATRTYIGTPVEQVMLHIYAALNYLQLGKLDSARVEILQVDIRLKKLGEDNPDNPLNYDPFARYLSGIIYEDLGEWSNAMIAYRKAYEAYQAHNQLYPVSIPLQLKQSLILMANKVGLVDEQKKYETEFDLKFSDLAKKTAHGSELIFIFHNGLAPVKKENAASVFSPVAGKLIRIAVPEYQARYNSISTAKLFIDNKYQKTTEITEDIASLQINNLQAHMPAITARALARTVAKYKLADDAGEQHPVAGLLVNVIGFATERADTRSWLTLPAEIQLARVNLPEGTHELSVELLNHSDNIVLRPEPVTINASGRSKYYISQHYSWMGNHQ